MSAETTAAPTTTAMPMPLPLPTGGDAPIAAMRRVNIIGNSGGGKTTFGRSLADILGRYECSLKQQGQRGECAESGEVPCATYSLPCIELDALFWLDGWKHRSRADFVAVVEAAIIEAMGDDGGRGFVIDGNYRNAADGLKLKYIDTIIWLDTPFCTNVYRATMRALHRAFTGTRLWDTSDNVETFGKIFSWQDSMILSTMRTYDMNRRRHAAWGEALRTSHPSVRFIHLRSTGEADAFLASLRRQCDEQRGSRGVACAESTTLHRGSGRGERGGAMGIAAIAGTVALLGFILTASVNIAHRKMK